MSKVVGVAGDRTSLWRGANSALIQAVAIILVAALVAFILRRFYYAIFPWISSFNVIFPPGTLAPWIEQWTAERDGIEIYALYVLVFTIIGTTTLVVFGLSLVKARWLQGLALLAFAAVTLRYASSLRFFPPSDVPGSVSLTAVFTAVLCVLLIFRRRIPERFALAVAILALMPACFVITSAIAASNYAYIFAPAQKLLDGAPLQAIYFQYEFLISALAAVWFRVGLSPNNFQFVGAAANFATILAVFLVSRRLFETKALAYLLLAAIVIFRILAAPWDPIYVFQLTPLRLDLWIVPFLIIYFRGPTSLLVPLVCGALIVVHGALGVVYTLGYLQLILTLAAFDALSHDGRSKLRQSLTAGNVVRVVAVGLYWAGCYMLAKYLFGQSSEATSLYQKIGIGFIPLSTQSLYWAMPIVVSSLWISLFLLRKNVSPAYLALGLSLIYFFLGNSIYFFGRSHELNLFSIAISLLFVAFYAFDAFSRSISANIAEGESRRRGLAAILLAALLLVAIVQACGDRIAFNLAAKLHGVVSLTLSPSDAFAEVQPSVDDTLAAVEERIGTGARVQFFITDPTKEFLLYQGDQNNTEFFYPFITSIFVADIVRGARDILIDGRYLLLDDEALAVLIAGGLAREEFGYETTVNGYTLVGREPPRGWGG